MADAVLRYVKGWVDAVLRYVTLSHVGKNMVIFGKGWYHKNDSFLWLVIWKNY